MRYLVCIAQKYTKIVEDFCEIEFKKNAYIGLSDIIRKAEAVTGNKVDGVTNYIEWIQID